MAAGDETAKLISVTQRGQATIPKAWRDQLGIDAPGEVVMVAVGDSIVLKPPRSLDELAGRHSGAFAEGKALEAAREWRAEDEERERTDGRLHGLEPDS